MLEQLQRAPEIPATGLKALPDEVNRAPTPTVLRGAMTEWPLVREARQSDEAAVDYLNRFYNGSAVRLIAAQPAERGRFFYRSDSKALNFDQGSAQLSEVLQALLDYRTDPQPPAIAMQAVSAPDCLPGLEEDNANPFVPAGTHARVWIGNAVTVAPHFDVADNIACVVAGRRRFILFPPEQTENIYPGPMDVTPAGVPISMVEMSDAELDRFPKYREALAAGFVAELDPGDAIYIPYLWWHGVQSLAPFNVLVNYWFNRNAGSAAYPFIALLRLAYTAFRHMPPEHREAWRAVYDAYVFQQAGDSMDAISTSHRHGESQGEAARISQALRGLFG